MYPGHIPTSCAQKGILTAGAAVGALLDPWRRGDLVGVLGETTGVDALSGLRDKMKETQAGRRILHERPTFDTDSVLKKLKECKEGTFGSTYYRYMESNGFKPSERPPVQFIDDSELAYVMRRYRETHDFAHTLTALNSSVAAEMVLKSFEWHQTGMPMCGLASLGGAIHLNTNQLHYLVNKGYPWARQAGQGELITSVMWEEEWDTNLDELRQRLLIPVAPLPP
eukprot:TRINITY_DN14679_c0_g1_i1.p1 TRINITY_DN14679_c0_g1~~TRINITY_DN14679_c0_g1_i1.p1  ORF type:complete len:240 (+),score=60.12 TRINITY_DN14679_c0_g1_i1:46-720(+)